MKLKMNHLIHRKPSHTEILRMANQVNGCQDDDITEFEMILNTNHNIMKSPIIRIYIEIFKKLLGRPVFIKLNLIQEGCS